MVSLASEEEDIIEALVTSLAIAITGAPGFSPQQLNNTITQKLLYLAITEFNLPVTYSWYLAGSFVESQSVSPESVETAFSNLPQAPSPSIQRSDEDDPDVYSDVAGTEASAEIDEQHTEDLFDAETELDKERELERSADFQIEPSAPEPGVADIDADVSISDVPSEVTAKDVEVPEGVDFPVEDIVQYLKKELNRYPLHSTDRFLTQFYQYHAPGKYHELYESVHHVRSALRAAREAVERLAITGGGQSEFKKAAANVGLYISDIHFELYENPDLRTTIDAVIGGTDIIEDALMVIEQLDSHEITTTHVAAMAMLQDFFYGWVWKFPALKISIATATGPSADEVIAARRETLETFEARLTEQQEKLIGELSDIRLIPAYQDYPAMNRDQINEKITELFSSYTSHSDSRRNQ